MSRPQMLSAIRCLKGGPWLMVGPWSDDPGGIIEIRQQRRRLFKRFLAACARHIPLSKSPQRPATSEVERK
jgi:hypothetical protein